jgi:hypothetical protein
MACNPQSTESSKGCFELKPKKAQEESSGRKLRKKAQEESSGRKLRKKAKPQPTSLSTSGCAELWRNLNQCQLYAAR